jgi:hypothetical protein
MKSHWIIKQTGYLLNAETGEYLKGADGQAICISGTLADAVDYVENDLCGTWEIDNSIQLVS